MKAVSFLPVYWEFNTVIFCIIYTRVYIYIYIYIYENVFITLIIDINNIICSRNDQVGVEILWLIKDGLVYLNKFVISVNLFTE